MISPACLYGDMVWLHMHKACPVALPIPDQMNEVVEFARKHGHLLTAINPYACLESQLEVIRDSVNSFKKEEFFEDLRIGHSETSGSSICVCFMPKTISETTWIWNSLAMSTET